jgi:hypothetical protein
MDSLVVPEQIQLKHNDITLSILKIYLNPVFLIVLYISKDDFYNRTNHNLS